MVADASISVWNANTGALVSQLAGHHVGVVCVRLHALTGTTLDPHLCVPHGLRSEGGTAQAVPSRLLLITGGADHAIMLWDVRAATCLQRLASHTAPVTALLVSGWILVSLAGVTSSGMYILPLLLEAAHTSTAGLFFCSGR